jgi:hypothetical protein
MSGNPNPQHNPTDGLAVAARVRLSGTGVTQLAGNEYEVTLSLGGTDTVTVTVDVEDVAGSAYSNIGEVVTKSYNNPSAGSPTWYKPSAASPYTDQSADVASVAAATSAGDLTMVVTGLAVGQAIVEFQFPTFDNTEGDDSATGNPKDMIYAQLIVNVTA